MISDSELKQEFKTACQNYKPKKFSNIVLRMLEKNFAFADYQEGFLNICIHGYEDMLEDFLRVYPNEHIFPSSAQKALKKAYQQEHDNVVVMLLDNEHISLNLNLKEFFSLLAHHPQREIMDKVLSLNERHYKQNLIISNGHPELTWLFCDDNHWVIEHFIDKGYLHGNEAIFQTLFKKYPNKIHNLSQFILSNQEKHLLKELTPLTNESATDAPLVVPHNEKDNNDTTRRFVHKKNKNKNKI